MLLDLDDREHGSIRKESFMFYQGIPKKYGTSRSRVSKFWDWLDREWLKARNSPRTNKRKGIVRYGHVNADADVTTYSGMYPLPNDMSLDECRSFAFGLMKLFPKDCPFTVTLHFGKDSDLLEEGNLHLHFEYSERDEFGIGRRQDAFETVKDKKPGKNVCKILETLREYGRRRFKELGYPVQEAGERTSPEYPRAFNRKLKKTGYDTRTKDIDRIREMTEIAVQSNSAQARKYWTDRLKRRVDEECTAIRQRAEADFREVCKRIEEYISVEERFNRDVDEMKMFDIKQVDDSIDKEEDVYYKIDDDIITIDDGSDLELMKKDGREIILKKKSVIDSRRREEDDEINKENYINEQKNIEIQHQASLGNEFFGINNQRSTSRFRKLAKRVDPNSQQYKNMKAILNKRKLKSYEDRTKDLRSAFEEAMNKADIKNKTTRSR